MPPRDKLGSRTRGRTGATCAVHVAGRSAASLPLAYFCTLIRPPPWHLASRQARAARQGSLLASARRDTKTVSLLMSGNCGYLRSNGRRAPMKERTPAHADVALSRGDLSNARAKMGRRRGRARRSVPWRAGWAAACDGSDYQAGESKAAKQVNRTLRAARHSASYREPLDRALTGMEHLGETTDALMIRQDELMKSSWHCLSGRVDLMRAGTDRLKRLFRVHLLSPTAAV